MKYSIFVILVLIFLVGSITTGYCQAPPPPIQEIPLDGGLSLLLAAGLAYGARKLGVFRKKTTEP